MTLSGLIYNIGLLATPVVRGPSGPVPGGHPERRETAAQMAPLVLAYILVTLLVQASRFIKRFYVRRFANNINRRMKGILYANLVRQSRVSLEKEGAGELMTKAISDVDDCVEGMRKFTTEVFDTGVALAGRGHAAGVRLAAGSAEPAVHALLLRLRGMDEKSRSSGPVRPTKRRRAH